MNLVQTKSVYSEFKDRDFRSGQEDAVQFIRESTKPVVCLCAPTGSGKSLIGMVAGEEARNGSDGKFAYLASSKQLQSQLQGDFPEAMVMQGRQNFPCNRHRQLRADQCTHYKGSPCPEKSKCYYEVHKKAVAAHPRQILNYHYFLTEGNYVGTFSDYPLLVADEGDLLEGLLTDFVGLTVTQRNLNDLGIDPPKYKTATSENGVEDWTRWAKTILLPSVSLRVRSLESTLENMRPGSPDFLELSNEFQTMQTIEAKAHMFIQNVDATWICERTEWNGTTTSWRFSPTWLTPDLSKANFFLHADQVAMMSATFPHVHIIAKTLGLEPGDIDHMEVPSTFPVANRPVYLNPVGDMSYKTFNDEQPKVLRKIEKLLAKHRHEKGIIHTVSWRLNQAVMDIGDPRLVTHDSYDKGETLRYFMDSKDPLVFVSPSSTRGVDLPDELCRFLIMAKAPFQSLSSKLVSSRLYSSSLGALWYRSMCAQEIVQACGRAVRHEKDHAVAYLLDKQMCEMVVDQQFLFPRYWLEAVDIL